MAELDPVYEELAQRVAITTVAEEGTLLVKTSSPGRQYESKSLASLGIGGDSIIIQESEKFTLTATDASSMYVTLMYVPDDIDIIEFSIRHAPLQEYGVDYRQNSMFPKRIEWVGLGLDGMLNEADVITIFYTRST